MPSQILHLQGRVLPSAEQRDVWIVDGHVTFHEQRGATTLRRGGWLLPGLVDAHAHLALASPLERGSAHDRVRASARVQLDAGVLLIREPGGPDHSSIGLGPHEGLPRVQAAGRFLAPPGGYVPGLAREVPIDRLAQAVAEEARASGAWVKLIGDFVGSEGRMEPHWDEAALKAAAKAAHAAGARITVHATHPEAIRMALEAGFDSIEHGTGMQEEHLAMMRERKAAWVPTLVITDLIPDFFEDALSPGGKDELVGWVRALPGRVGAAAKGGVAVLAGTDAGLVPHGLVGKEVELLRKAGFTPERALAAASWEARKYLGLPGLEEGAHADITVYDADPRTGGAALRRPALTILDGRIVGGAPTAG